MLKLFLLCNFLLGVCYSKSTNGHLRPNARMFGKQQYTSTVIENRVVTTLVPSSCIQVDATLPPCRNMRFLHFPSYAEIGLAYNQTVNKTEAALKEVQPKVVSTVLGWGEYLGLFAPTVTVTSTSLVVTTVQNQDVVVTYALKGCKPLKLPIEIDRCPSDVPVIQEVLPTSRVQVMPTAAPQVHDVTNNNLGDGSVNHNLLEGSVPQVKGNAAMSQPTQKL